MNLSYYIARKYFFSKRKRNISNVITAISVLGFAFGSMALIVVLSAFNGFEVLVDSLYHSFYPDIKITPKTGKVFLPDSSKLKQIVNLQDVLYGSEILEENVLLKYDRKQNIATIKGVSANYTKMVRMDSLIVQGDSRLQRGVFNYAIVGGGIAYKLSVNPYNHMVPLHVYVPRRDGNPLIRPDKAFSEGKILPSGIFVLEESIDNKYVFVSMRFAREILDYPNQISSYEINLKNEDRLFEVQKTIQQLLGNDFNVKNRYQQNEVLYRIMKSEKIAVYLILTFILLIAAFNVTGSLYMLVIEKENDIRVMQAMGADASLIKRIFLMEGFIVTMLGSVIGIGIGVAICYVQQKYGLIKFGGEGSMVVEAYPVKMNFWDFPVVLGTAVVIGFITSYYPALRASRLSVSR
ncbi:MAG: FtsX-like permease family protein [Bacteroidia bacterium]|nr:FtsX-like permease family protein [Bacteroidia bacterium]